MLVFLETAIVFFGNFTTRLPSGRQQMKKTPEKPCIFTRSGSPAGKIRAEGPPPRFLKTPNPYDMIILRIMGYFLVPAAKARARKRDRQSGGKNMRNTNLLKKGMTLMLSIALILCLSVSALLLLFYNNLQAAASTRIQNNHQKILWSIDTDMETIAQTIQNTAFSSAVQSLFLNNLKHPQISMQAMVRDVFSQAFSYNRYLVGIALYDNNRDYLFSSGRATIAPDDLPAYWGEIHGVAWSGSRDAAACAQPDQIHIVFPVYEKSPTRLITNNRLGYLLFILTSDWLQDVFAGKGEDAYISLISAKGEPISSFCPAKEAGTANRVNICSTEIESTGWVLKSDLIKMTIAEDMKPMLILACFSVAMTILLFGWMIRYDRNAISTPLGQIQDFMENIPDIHARMSVPSNQKNELLDMMNVLNGMLSTLEAKNDELLQSKVHILQEESARQQMELIAYRNQVNPHFLYNTLDCMRGMALMYRAPEIVDMTQALSSMFHYTVKGDVTATLSEEILNVENYAKIMAYRFTKEFTVDLPKDPRFDRILFIRNLLQPLVENAVQHGLNQASDNGRIGVEITEEEPLMLRIRVTDNGRGMTEEQLQALNDQLRQTRQKYAEITPTQAHIGLQNITRRLFLHYGEQASLQIQSALNRGTTVEILLPKVEMEAEET